MITFTFPTVLIIVAHLLGIVCAVYALWRSRTPQGATAWILGLIAYPYFIVPLFLIFGRNKFVGYARLRQARDAKVQVEVKEATAMFALHESEPAGTLRVVGEIARQAYQPGFTRGNELELLIDGERTYARMIQAIESAEKYILFQFYIFCADSAGQPFVDALCRRAREGIRVHFLYDDVGTHLPKRVVKALKSAGVQVASFQWGLRRHSRLQVNFRNHRKVIVVDGKIAFVGGLNIGDEYLGRSKYGAWRDTHVRLEGPAAAAAQLAFVKDWYWASNDVPPADWEIQTSGESVRENTSTVNASAEVLVLHTGPADREETCLLAHLALIHGATKRIWISSPYFVPPEGLTNALSLAVRRGVDVRILLPTVTDSRSVEYASEIYVAHLLAIGVKFFRYRDGFLHQKVMLIDDTAASVGSPNLDTRSLFINFEIAAISSHAPFVTEVDAMLAADFRRSTLYSLESLTKLPAYHRFFARICHLFSPML